MVGRKKHYSGDRNRVFSSLKVSKNSGEEDTSGVKDYGGGGRGDGEEGRVPAVQFGTTQIPSSHSRPVQYNPAGGDSFRRRDDPGGSREYKQGGSPPRPWGRGGSPGRSEGGHRMSGSRQESRRRSAERRDSRRMSPGRQDYGRMSPGRHSRGMSPGRYVDHRPLSPGRHQVRFEGHIMGDMVQPQWNSFGRSQDREGRKREAGGGQEMFQGKRHRPGSPPLEERSQLPIPGLSNLAGCNIQEEFPEWGVKGVLDKMLTSTSGQINVLDSNKKKKQLVLFHVNQVWIPTGSAHVQFLEVFPLSELKNCLGEGIELLLNARRLSGAKYELQATAVWTKTSPPSHAVWTKKSPPSHYKTPDLLADLTLRVKENLFTSGDGAQKPNPLAGVPDLAVVGQVREYFSQEMGLLHLDRPGSEEHVVLFHLNQVWRGEAGTCQPLTEVQEQTLQVFLPVGSKVMVNMRKLPANPYSGLKYQATILWRKSGGDIGSGKLPAEYLTKFGPVKMREKLVAELDCQHDNFKSILKFSLSPFNVDYMPVHAIINGLPGDWQGQVVAGVGQDFGIVKVSHRVEGRVIGSGVETLFVLFHLEDVWDLGGRPAIQSPGLTISSLLHSWVDLTARSLCAKQEPDRLIEHQRNLIREDRKWAAIPLLQAVAVCMKTGPTGQVNAANLPKPTSLRNQPGCFGTNGQAVPSSKFYLSASLACQLDLKVKQFLETPGKMPGLPYERVLAHRVSTRSASRTESILDSLREKVDINNSARFLYGGLDKNIPRLDSQQANRLPETVMGATVKIKYLHRRHFVSDCGLAELKVGVDGMSVTTLVFFELARYRFFTPPDCFARDLTNITSISSTDQFCVHAMLSNVTLSKSGNRVPYVALVVWNEDLRGEVGAPVPRQFPDSHWDRQELADSCAGTVQKLLRKVDPPGKRQDDSNEVVAIDTASDKEGTSKGKSKKSSQYIVSSPIWTWSADLIPVPENIQTISTDVKLFNPRKVCTKDGQIMPGLEGITGKVEQILSDNILLVSFGHESTSSRNLALCSWDDIFDSPMLSKSDGGRFTSTAAMLGQSVKGRKIRLRGLCKKGLKVKLNVVPLLSSPEHNPAGVHYCSSGVVLWSRHKSRGVPVSQDLASHYLTDDFKIHFMKVIRSLNQEGDTDTELSTPPDKFNKSVTEEAKTKSQEKRLARKIIRAEYLDESVTEKTIAVVENSSVNNKSLPTPVSTKKVDKNKPIVWKNIVNNLYGKVIRIIDKNYGIAAGFITQTGTCVAFQVLFDTFDVYIGDQDCNELGKKLSDVMQVGDYLKFNAVRIEEVEQVEGPRGIQYLATALITARTSDGIRAMQIPSKAAKIVSLDQVTPNKVSNFKVVVGVMNSTKLNKQEVEILSQLTSGEVAKEVLDNPGLQGSEVSHHESEASDDEITVVEDEVTEEESPETLKAADQLESVTKELKPSELRKLIMNYVDLVNKLVERNPRTKINLDTFSKTVKIDKDLKFYERFLVALGQRCKMAPKGVKVGHVFVTQAQVSLIKSKGVVTSDHVEVQDTKQDITEQFSSQELRKFLMSFMKYIDNRKKKESPSKSDTSLQEIGKERNVTQEVARNLLAAIQAKCREAPRGEDGARQGFKLQNIFITPAWVDKFVNHSQ